MTLGLRDFAWEHGYRLRNLADGGPVPPLRRSHRGHGRAAYSGHDAELALIGRCGCVSLDAGRANGAPADGNSRSELYAVLVCKSRRQLTARLSAFVEAGVAVRQLGDTEAAGPAPLGRLADVLHAIGAYRRRGGNTGAAPSALLRGARRPDSTQAVRDGCTDRDLRPTVRKASYQGELGPALGRGQADRVATAS